MKVYTTIASLQNALKPFREKGDSIGFVPTMGALHDGHLSLLRESKKQNPVSVSSIFVNPTQFNDKQDLANYPRDLQKDCDMLEAEDCDFVFAPTVDEMYPEKDTRTFDFGIMGEVMEGKHRPGHFNGVAQIVSKLFDAVLPNRAYFGQKDFQQLAIIRRLTEDFNYPIEIIGCPIIREADGLAMSSRNMLLTPEHRKGAPKIYQTLKKAREMALHHPLSKIESTVEQLVQQNGLFQLEYFQICDTKTLNPVNEIDPQKPATACIAVFAGKVRLIDNISIIS